MNLAILVLVVQESFRRTIEENLSNIGSRGAIKFRRALPRRSDDARAAHKQQDVVEARRAARSQGM